jgi:electron transport complex protein RnfB
MTADIADLIDAILPQTQCTRCGFEGCRPYAQAIADGRAPINRCPPGGRAAIAELAALLSAPLAELDPACGPEGPHLKARVDEALCIGCTKCIVACPVDAIIGAPKRMHTVIESLCTGCELCIPPCPVDCIDMQAHAAHPQWTRADAQAARERLLARRQRLERERVEAERRLERKALRKLARLAHEAPDEGTERKREVIEAAIRKARERLAAGVRAPARGDAESATGRS